MIRLREIARRLRERRSHATLLGLGIVMLVVPSAALSLTNTISMTGRTTADYQALVVTANTLKPKACDGIDLTNVISGAGIVKGTSGNDLILATSPNSTINGMGGSDCLVIGNGAEGTLIGGDSGEDPADMDVCIGGQLTKYERCEDVQNLN